MQKFKFILDRKCTVWFREFHEVEAETVEEAEKIMLKNNADDNTDATFIYQDMLDDTLENTDDYEILNDANGESIYSTL